MSMRLRDEIVELSNDLQQLNKKLIQMRNRCRNGSYRYTDLVEISQQMLEQIFIEQSNTTIATCLLYDALRRLEDAE